MNRHRNFIAEFAGRIQNLFHRRFPASRALEVRGTSGVRGRQQKCVSQTSGLKTWPALAGLACLLASTARTQDTHFAFDAAGNLLAQGSEIVASPQILGEPQLQVVLPGDLASFSVVVADTRSASYQWQINGTNLAGANRDALLLNHVSASNEGWYSVVIANGSGIVTSAPAALLIDSRGNGMPDSWQLAHFGNLNQTADGDFDGDGVSNLQEFLDGTNPTNSTSRLYGLTLYSDGGQVTVSPSRFSFTNGETVTLTATAFAPNTFRGWAGDTVAADNSITLTMTNNKTVFALLGSAYDVAWTNVGGGDWDVASNWNPNLVPGSSDNVFITNTVAVTINGSADCANLALGNLNSTPTLTGSGTLTLHGTASWVRGTMSGGGRTVIDTGATMNLANAIQIDLTSRTLENAGTVLWTGGSIALNTAVVTNRAGALFETRGAGSFVFAAGRSRFDNTGTFRKSVNTGTTSIASFISFNNFGTVELQTGTLVLAGGGANNGNYSVPVGTTLNLAGGIHTASSGSSITGAGGFTVSGAMASLDGLVNVNGTNLFTDGTTDLTGNYICTNNSLIISGGAVSFDGTGTVMPAILNLSAGALDGGQLVTVGTAMNWTGGTMRGGGRTFIPAEVTLNVANASQVNLFARTLENAGIVLWTGRNIAMDTAIVTNRAGALFETQGTGSLIFAAGRSRFDNAGMFRKSVNAGIMTVASFIGLNNYGTVELLTGVLNLAGGGANSGNYSVPVGTTLNLSGGTFTANSGSSIVGAGDFTVSGSVVATLGGLVNVSGRNLFSGGTAGLTGNYICTNNTLTISGGSASFDGTGTVAPALLDLSAGTLGGGQFVTVTHMMNWTGGTMGGSGRTFIPAGLTLNVANSSQVNLFSRTLENEGTVLWTGGNIALDTAVVTNRAGALFETQGAGSLIFAAGRSRFDNVGTFRKSINAGTTTIAAFIGLNNYGTVEILTGTLELAGGGANSGNYAVAVDTTLNLSGGTFTASSGSSIAGKGGFSVSRSAVASLGGLVNVSGGNLFSGGTASLTGNYICTNNTLTISGGGASFDGTGTLAPALLNLSSGTLGGGQLVKVGRMMNWTGGTMSGSGRTFIPAGAMLNVANASQVNLFSRTLENAGTVLWTGGNVAMDTAVVTNRAGALFETQGAGALIFAAGRSRFDNAGTFRKSVNTGTTTIAMFVGFNNYGTVDIRSGILTANGGYTCTANGMLTCAIAGTNVGTGYGRLQVAGTVELNGVLGVVFTGGFNPTTNDAFTVLTAGARTGTFGSFDYPPGLVTMALTNTATSVIVRVTDVRLVPEPMFLQPELSGTDIRLMWTSVPNSVYRLEYTTDLSLTNWAGLAGDVTSLTNIAGRTDTFTLSNRFYRVRVIP